MYEPQNLEQIRLLAAGHAEISHAVLAWLNGVYSKLRWTVALALSTPQILP